MFYGNAETKTNYQVAFYSLLGENSHFSEWKELPKTRAISVANYKGINDLAWFSNGYFSVEQLNNNNYLYNDLRYPLVKIKDGYVSVFSLELFKENSRINMKSFRPKVDSFGDAISDLWERMKGI